MFSSSGTTSLFCDERMSPEANFLNSIVSYMIDSALLPSESSLPKVQTTQYKVSSRSLLPSRTYKNTFTMPNLLGALWRPRSPRRTQARRDKPFRLQLKSLSLNRSTRSTTVSTDGSCGSSDTTMSGISASAKTFSNPGEGDVEMMSDGDGESLEVDSEDIDQQFDGESADGDIEDSLEDESEEEEDGNDVEVEETDDEVNYDANEALKIVDIDTQVDILSRRFEEQMISSREEKIHVEGNALNQKRAEGWAEDTLQLSLRMETRGLYPMLPIEWRRDFPYLSRHLFSANDEEVYLSPFARASKLQDSTAADRLLTFI